MTTLFQISFTDEERRRYAEFCLWLNGKLMNTSPVIEQSPEELRRLGQQKDDPRMANSATQNIPHAKAPIGAEPPAASRTSNPQTPPEVRDRWARNRKGVEVPQPEGYIAGQGRIWKTEEKKGKNGPYLKVTWEPIAGAGHVDCSCFDSSLFPWIAKAKAEGNRVTLYTVRSGNYLNLVGIRA